MSRFTQFANPSAKSFLLRGGHVIRRKGGAASMIPQIAELRLSVSSTAISAALMFGAGLVGTPAALAGTCVETALGSGIFECSDPADAGTDTTQILFGAPVSVTTQAGFGITTAAGDAFIINGTNGTSFNDAEASVITGQQNGISANNTITGSLTLTSSGTVTGLNGDGVAALAGVGTADLSITSNIATGAERGIEAFNFGTGVLTVNSTGTASGTISVGIGAINSANGTDLNIASANAFGGDGGIYAYNSGTGALTVTSTGIATGMVFDGIYAVNSANGTDLTVTAANTNGGDNGISASNLGTGALTVTSTGMATGTNENGFYVYNSSNGTGLTVNAIDSNGGRTGIFAENDGSGALSITSTGSATGIYGYGIFASNSVNGTDLTVTAVDTSGDDSGIGLENDGTGALIAISTGTATGTNDDGIEAVNSANGTDLTITAAHTNGLLDGIDARNSGTGALTIVSTGTATGTNGDGIDAANNAIGTGLMITAADTNGGQNGIDASNGGIGALTVISTGTAIGANANGINAVNSGVGTVLSITAAEVIGGTNGIRALSFGTAGLTISASGDVTGQTADGIYAYNNVSASMLINQAAGTTITGAVDGIYANNLGGSLTINALGTVIGLADDGIDARNAVGTTNLSITSDVATGADNGVFASNLGTGALMITSTGTATGSVFIGIVALNSANGTDLTVTADNVTGGIHGIYAVNQGAGPLAITTSGTVEGGIGNAVIAATAGSTIAVNNNGTLESGAGLALVTNGGVTTLTNTGTINGGVQLSAFNDVSNNSGVFNAVIDSDFGAGNDLFTNTGTVASAGAVTLIDLEQFTNSGLVTMTNDVIGDVFTIDGAYVGDNGTLGFDVNFDGAGVADTLVILGAATGTTLLSINDISISPNFDNTILVVDAGAGSAADAFTLDLESPTIGFLTYDLFFEMAANDFFLSNTIGTPVFQTLKFAEGAQSLWYRSADAWAAHMASRRDAPDSALWMQTYGATTDRDESSDFTSGGFSQAITLDYSQDYFGLQAGYDFGPGATDGEGVLFGVTGGYLNSTLGFEGLADRVEYDVFNIGAYAGFKAGGFFANALAKYDFIDADVTAPTPGYSAQLDGEAYGARFEAGYRMGGDSFFANRSSVSNISAATLMISPPLVQPSISTGSKACAAWRA